MVLEMNVLDGIFYRKKILRPKYHWVGIEYLQSVTRHLRLALVFMWVGALRERLDCYFSGLFC